MFWGRSFPLQSTGWKATSKVSSFPPSSEIIYRWRDLKRFLMCNQQCWEDLAGESLVRDCWAVRVVVQHLESSFLQPARHLRCLWSLWACALSKIDPATTKFPQGERRWWNICPEIKVDRMGWPEISCSILYNISPLILSSFQCISMHSDASTKNTQFPLLPSLAPMIEFSKTISTRIFPLPLIWSIVISAAWRILCLQRTSSTLLYYIREII